MHLYTARAPRTRRRALVPLLLVVLMTAWYTVVPMGDASASTSTISGVVFEDHDRDGAPDAGEPRWSGKAVWVLTGDGSAFVASAVTDATGRYEVGGLTPGSYLVRYHPTAWRDVRDAWVPTTTSGVWPEAILPVDGEQRFDLGWRRIATTNDWSSPLTTHSGPSGVRVESFTDAVTARDVHDALLSGSLHGQELALTSIQFGHPGTTFSVCKHSVSGTAGTYDNFSATCNVDYDDWLTTRHHRLFHEYGHAWSRYHQKVVNQWNDLDAYLVARGVDPEDPRLATTHAWLPGELIAEDFRTLFGSPAARAYPHENDDIPPADEVEGLAAWLSGAFMDGTNRDPLPSDRPPVVDQLMPSDGATVSGTQHVSVRATDDVTAPNRLNVEMRVDETSYPGVYDAQTGRWTARVDTTAFPDGQAVFEARAADEAGQVTSVTSRVTVHNGSATPVPDPTPEQTPSSDMVLTSGTASAGGSWFAWVRASVRVDGVPARGVAVEADWVGDGRHGGVGRATCTTGTDGTCQVQVEQAKRVASITFTITAPEHGRVVVAKP